VQAAGQRGVGAAGVAGAHLCLRRSGARAGGRPALGPGGMWIWMWMWMWMGMGAGYGSFMWRCPIPTPVSNHATHHHHHTVPAPPGPNPRRAAQQAAAAQLPPRAATGQRRAACKTRQLRAWQRGGCGQAVQWTGSLGCTCCHVATRHTRSAMSSRGGGACV